MKKSYCTHFTNIKNEKFCNLLKEKTNVKTCEGLCNPPLLSPELWLCLECCFIACGRYENKCSLVHFKNTTHYLNINLKSLKIWCYHCDSEFDEMINDCDDEEINFKKIKKNNASLEKLKVFKEKIEKAVSNFMKNLKQEKVELKPFIEEKKTSNLNNENLFGLKNIGNTCFFNSVMQCLNATTPLTSIYLKNQNFKDININLASQEKPHIQEDGDGWITVNSHLPNKSKKNKGKKDKEKNESSSTTIDTANINKKFQDFLVEGRRSKNKCYDPSPLFKSISNIFARFRGYAQQDAQELLRFFLDALSIGEEKMIVSRNQNTEFKGKLKSTYIENIFGAYLCNYLKCLNPECGFENRTFDFFLDLSVNIPEKQKEKESVYISKPSTSTSSRKRNNQKRHIKKKKHQKIIKITDDAEEEESQQDNNENNGENEEKTEIFLEKTEKDHEMLPKKEKEEYIPNNCSQEIFKTPQENEISKEKNEIPPNKNEKQTEKISSLQEERKNIEEIAADKVFEENDELPFRPIDNKKLDIVPYLDKDLYLLYEPNYKIHKVNYENISLEDCLEDFFNYEILNIKDNYFSCEKCKKEDRIPSTAIKKFFLYDPPSILTIVLKRFVQKSIGKFEKNHTSIKIPFKLNLDKFTLLKAKKTVEETEIHHNQMHNYELYAIVDHSGSISGGHYIAYAKFENNWFVFNDSDFRITRIEHVVCTQPYILFYKKIE